MYHRLLLFMRPLRLPPLLSLFPYTTLFRSYLLRPRMLGSCALLFVGLVPDLLIAQPVTARVQPAATNVTLGSSATLCLEVQGVDRKSTRLNSSHLGISYAVFCLKKKK